jgi:AcrR family transcriptional regulator
MSRYSSDADIRLLKAGEVLVREKGFLGFSIRELCQKANVNLGMFHYYFKSKNDFGRKVFGTLYEDFFGKFEYRVLLGKTELENLEISLRDLSSFVRDNGKIIMFLLNDSLSGCQLTTEVIKKSIPKHAGVIFDLIKKCMKKGYLAKMPPENAFAIIASSVISPMMMFYVGKKVFLSDKTNRQADKLEKLILSNKAIEARIKTALNLLKVEPGGKK